MQVDAALLHGSKQRTNPPVPRLGSSQLVAVRDPETDHRVENLARQLSLISLSVKGTTSHTSTDDRLVSVHGVLNQTALAVTGQGVPLTSSELSDHRCEAICSMGTCYRPTPRPFIPKIIAPLIGVHPVCIC